MCNYVLIKGKENVKDILMALCTVLGVLGNDLSLYEKLPWNFLVKTFKLKNTKGDPKTISL